MGAVGDEQHEWVERTGKAVHLRRRLTEAERGDLSERDLRDTPEARERLAAALPGLPPLAREFAIDEIGAAR